MAVTFAEARKAIAGFVVTLTGVAGEAVSIGLVPTHDTKWVQFAIACATALGTAIAVYATPKGATVTQRLEALEKQVVVPLGTIVKAAQDAPIPESWKQDAETINDAIDKHAGVAATAPWPTQGAPA